MSSLPPDPGVSHPNTEKNVAQRFTSDVFPFHPVCFIEEQFLQAFRHPNLSTRLKNIRISRLHWAFTYFWYKISDWYNPNVFYSLFYPDIFLSGSLTKILMSFWILMRISWENDILMRIFQFSWESLTSFFAYEILIFLMRTESSKESREILMRFSWENCILIRFSHELFYWWESRFSRKRWKLLRVSWDSHEKIFSRKLCFCFFSWLYCVIHGSQDSRAPFWTGIVARTGSVTCIRP